MITDYEYERYFYTGSHRKCLLFVEQDANVTIVAGKPPQITKTGGSPLIITNDNILQEKFELQENFNSSENWAFGSVEPSAISFDIREDGSIPILRDQLLRLYLYFDDDSSTLLYIGTYYIDEDELSDDSKSRTISGYDMVQSIRDVDIIDMYRGLFNAHEEPDPEDPEQKIWVPGREKITVKEARDKFFAYIADKENGEGIPIKQETVELPNDNFEFAFDVDTEALSGGQFLEDICEINGRYGHLGRQLSTENATKNYQIFQYIIVERYDEPGQKIGNELRLHGMMKGLYQTLSIGKIRVYNRDSIRLAGYDEGYYKTKMSTYNIYDNILIDDLTKSKTQEQVLKAMMKNIYDSVRYRKYVPFTAKFPADLCREVGDRITLYSDIDLQIDEDNPKSFKTLIFQRRISGIQNMVDEYSAKGDKKLPAFGDYSSSSGYSAKSSRSGYSSGSYSKEKELTDGEYRLMDMTTDDFIAYLHNVGIELLDEPSECLVEYVRTGEGHQVELSWKDPEDISTFEPHPCAWAGTVVVRKENEPPKWRWDDTATIVNSTTRDQYSETPFVDDTIEENKTYYYGIYPYYVALDDQDHPRRHYTWTKIYRITTYMPMPVPVLSSLSASGTSITAYYEIPAWSDGSYTSCKLVYKKGAIPTSVTDGTAVDISTTGTSKVLDGLDELSKYYFVIYLSDGNTTNTSEPKDCTTSRNEGYDFAYTGSIQTFTAPKTGIYQLETWGAQGGDAEDTENNLVARGGYGAYAKGEIILEQGETIYIAVGGQNGYNGGGNSDSPLLMQIKGANWLTDLERGKVPDPDPHDFGSVADGVFTASTTKVYRYDTTFAKSLFTGNKTITVEARLYYVPYELSYDFDLMFYKTSDSAASGRIVRLVFANGLNEPHEAMVFFNSTETAYAYLLDDEQYHNSWHTVKLVLTITNSKFTAVYAYVDDVQKLGSGISVSTDINEFIGNDTVKTRFVTVPDSKVDYVKISIEDA